MRSALWAPLAVTGLAHALLLAVPLHFDPPTDTPDPVVKVRLRPPEPEPEPEPPPEPEPEPEEPEPEPELEPPPEPPPPEPKPKPKRDEPPPPTEPEPPPPAEPEPPPPSEPEPPPIHIPATASPKAVPVPVRPQAPRGMSKTELRTYGMGVHGAMARHRRYPPAALQQRLEGVVKVRLVVDRRGRLVGKPTVARSSGHRVLDEEALRMVKVAAPFEPLPSNADKDTMVFVIPMDFSMPKKK